MPDWESYLNGELSIFCETKGEAELLARMSLQAGVPRDRGRRTTGYRIDGEGRVWVSGNDDPEWHVKYGLTKRWVYFTDFIREPKVKFNRDEFLDMLSGT